VSQLEYRGRGRNKRVIAEGDVLHCFQEQPGDVLMP
jgi:hypothetical protein